MAVHLPAAGLRARAQPGRRHLVAAQARHRQLSPPPNMDYLVRIVKRKLKKIQYRPHLITGCLAATGLAIEA